ncbi:MAG TPA: polysaccharide deacetylase family protein [Terriglobales bacterium]|nr:polysaccharide deacetylase family protein [Terriglobales bacterium]
MSRKVTIVMYHYVRDLEHSRFPAIKGLTVERFCRQLDYIQAHYTPIATEDLIRALSPAKKELPPNSILLTFDDGYSDHFTNVFPMLDARGIRGCFFPSARTIAEGVVLDVNKIQFVLASVPDAGFLLDQVFSSLAEFHSEYELKSKEDYLLALMGQNRYDSREVTMLKRLLQRELPEPVRREIVRRLFVEHVTADEAAFACELYMSADQIACLRRHGMHIGSHGYAHAWLNHISPEAQVIEVDRSLEFLQKLGVGRDEWTIGYPYGGYNDSLLQILRDLHCRLGFTAEARVADLDLDNPLTLPRVDTNDLPS